MLSHDKQAYKMIHLPGKAIRQFPFSTGQLFYGDKSSKPNLVIL